MLTVTTAPTTEPLTLAEVKDHVRPPGDEDDKYLQALTVAARELCETHTDRALPVTGFRESFDCFPSSGLIELSRPPVTAVSSVQYIDSDGATQTLAADQYVVDTASEPARIIRAYGVTWPTVRREGVAEPVQVNFTAGYAAAPAVVKQAMLLLIGNWYENREAVTERAMHELPMAVKALLASACWGAYP